MATSSASDISQGKDWDVVGEPRCGGLCCSSGGCICIWDPSGDGRKRSFPVRHAGTGVSMLLDLSWFGRLAFILEDSWRQGSQYPMWLVQELVHLPASLLQTI